MDNVLLDKPFLTEVQAVAANPSVSPLSMIANAVLDVFGSKSAREKVQQQVRLVLSLHVLFACRDVLLNMSIDK
jgi:hypothetical protein